MTSSMIKLGWNGEEGWRTVELWSSRVPVEGEKLEFWNPDGSAAEVDPELDGNAFYVDEVCWVGFKSQVGSGSKRLTPIVCLVSKAELQSRERADS